MAVLTITAIITFAFLLIFLGVGAGAGLAILMNLKTIALIIGLILASFLLKSLLKK